MPPVPRFPYVSAFTTLPECENVNGVPSGWSGKPK